MVIEFNKLSTSDLIVNEIYEGGTEPGKGSEVISKLIPGLSNSGGFRIKSAGQQDFLCVLYADNKHPEWINIFTSEDGKFVYYGDNKEAGISVLDSTKRGMKFLNRANEKLIAKNRIQIPPILVFVKAEKGWDVRFLGLAVPGFGGFGSREQLNFLEEVSFKEKDGDVHNYKSTYTLLNIKRISREWLRDIMEGKAYASEHAPEVWRKWVNNGECDALINEVEPFGSTKLNEKIEKNKKLSKSVFLKGSELTSHSQTYIKSKGFNYSQANIKNLYLSLRSKPFVIISGISGTGKTKIVQLFAESIGATEDNDQFMLIPVRPDWSDGSELLGYTDIAGDFKEGPLTKLLIHAKEHPERPHFLLLDEMNLARVEYYFSDILSVMESRTLSAEGFSSSKLAETADGEPLFFPDNLYIIGTVNMDETTHPFSKKVLDRANTLQFNEIDLLNLNFLKESTDDQIEPIQLANESLQASYIQISHIYPQHEKLIVKVSNELDRINNILKPIHAQVGYRVRDEICFYLAHNAEAGNLLSEDEALDFCFMQKILPRIAGSGERVDNVLTELARALNEETLPLCTAKIKAMQEKLEYDEFTAFW